jgi:putative addiction module component (TIGR02574 family)
VKAARRRPDDDGESALRATPALPPKQRAQIVGRVLETFDAGPDDGPEDVERAWAKEIKRRIDDIDSGRVKLIPAEQIHRELTRDARRRLSSRRPRRS